MDKFDHQYFELDPSNIIHADLLHEYNDASEDIDTNLPKPYGLPLQTSLHAYSDHAHERKIRRSVSGILVYVGKTPVYWTARR